MTAPLSILNPLGSHASTCGYCSPPGERSAACSSYTFGLQPMQMSCLIYQKMIDRGWRRSGTYCYKPDLARSCCPQYTIKLDALAFKETRGHRKLLNRWNRFVLYGDQDVQEADGFTDGVAVKKSLNSTSKKVPFDLVNCVHESESTFLPSGSKAKHKLEVTMEPSSFTDEKFQLFKKYQETIHHDHDSSRSGFKRFLVDNPLVREKIQYTSSPPAHLPTEYGAYHQMYRLDGKLIAMGVIDVLPYCVSSVYFMYDNTWENFSLGKLSALREVSLAKEIHDAGVKDMQFLYMGFYIYTCPKMVYKGEYSPSYLADPETYEWFPLEKCKPLLAVNHYACFSHPEHSLKAPASKESSEPGNLTNDSLAGIHLLDKIEGNAVSVVPLQKSQEWKDSYNRQLLLESIHLLGPQVAREAVLTLRYY